MATLERTNLFLHTGKLDPVLAFQSYCSEEIFRFDRQKLLVPHWHVLWLADDLKESGAYVACDFLGLPIIIHPVNDEPMGFINYCVHRYAKIVQDAKRFMSNLTSMAGSVGMMTGL